MRLPLLYGLLLSCLALPVSATRLLIFGDSLSAGYQLPADRAWPALLQRQWQDQGRDWQVINASVSGETTQGGNARLASLLSRHQPDWVLIELGANDGLRGLAVAQTQRNLESMIKTAQQTGSQVILTQIRLPPNYGARYVQQFDQLYPALATQYHLPLLPFFMEKIITEPTLLLSDGLHPNAQAQPIIRDQVAEFVVPYLETSAKLNK